MIRNQFQLIGYLGNDPDVKRLESGKIVCQFSLAVNERGKNKDGEKTTFTSWFKMTAWGKTAEIAETLLKKGSQVVTQGRIQPGSYQNKNGDTVYKTDFIVNEFQLISGSASNESPMQPQTSAEPVTSNRASDGDDDLPF